MWIRCTGWVWGSNATNIARHPCLLPASIAGKVARVSIFLPWLFAAFYNNNEGTAVVSLKKM
jgi:hypothetical protein